IAGSNGTDQLGRYIYTGPTAPPPPAIPQPQDPSDGSYAGTAPPLDWSAVNGATKYDVQYAPIGDGCDWSSPMTVLGITDTSTQLTGLSNDTTYCWRVQADNASGASGYSDPFQFTVLGIPTPLAPPNASTINGNSATLQWTGITGATGYEVQYGTQGDGCSYGDPISVDGTSYDTGALDPGNYCWHVQAVSADGSSGYDEDFQFTVSSPPNAPQLLTPADGSTTQDTKPDFTWTDQSASGATAYEILIAQAGGGGFLGSLGAAPSCGGVPVVDTTVNAASFTPTTALSDGTYCWQVDSINAYDVASAFSPSRTFTVQQEVPPSVTLDSYTNPVSQANETSASASGTVGSPANT